MIRMPIRRSIPIAALLAHLTSFALFALFATSAMASDFERPPIPAVAGIPIDFILFASTLIGVALFHHHTLRVAATGLAAISLYNVFFSSFKHGMGLSGLLAHAGHEWVVVANLFCLLTGFALLANHFEESEVPKLLPRYLPDDWRGGLVLLAVVFVLSSFLDNIAAAMIGGAIAQTVFDRKVHVGYIAAIVAASNAGGAGSVVGDTTTTMMWISGISPIAVLPAFLASGAALLVFGVPAAIQQHRYSPILKDAAPDLHVDWSRMGVVGVILGAAIGVNVFVNLELGERAESFPFIGVAVWAAILAT
ncbi:citrate transporter, partial [Myxococcota bacterium]|nr:citrate transporter [Myxococcota bacterium]